MYDMIIEAFTNECFPDYQSDVMTSNYYSSSQQYLFAILSYEISNLSDLESIKLELDLFQEQYIIHYQAQQNLKLKGLILK